LLRLKRLTSPWRFFLKNDSFNLVYFNVKQRTHKRSSILFRLDFPNGAFFRRLALNSLVTATAPILNAWFLSSMNRPSIVSGTTDEHAAWKILFFKRSLILHFLELFALGVVFLGKA
jgi:hypothetical protein